MKNLINLGLLGSSIIGGSICTINSIKKDVELRNHKLDIHKKLILFYLTIKILFKK